MKSQVWFDPEKSPRRKREPNPGSSALEADASATNRFTGLVVKASASGAEDPGFESRLPRDFSGSSHTSDSKIGTPVATLPGAWHNRVSAETGRPRCQYTANGGGRKLDLQLLSQCGTT